MKFKHRGWIGFDIDATLAEYSGWIGFSRIGGPVPTMVDLLVDYVNNGWEVRIFTGRVAPDPDSDDIPVEERRKLIREWLNKNVVPLLPEDYPEIKITHEKDKSLFYMYDDRAGGVVPSKGILYSSLLKSVYHRLELLVNSASSTPNGVTYTSSVVDLERNKSILDTVREALSLMTQDLPDAK